MTTIRHRRNTSVEWEVLNPILLSGEPGYETDTGREKRGDGSTRWNDLDYFLPESDVRQLINDAIVHTGGPGGVTEEDLQAHVDSLNPHPAWDDGPDFRLLYENAKV